jgi:hypothetical protein
MGKNSINKWYGKLQIKRTDVKNEVVTTIHVDFVKDQDIVRPALAALADRLGNN